MAMRLALAQINTVVGDLDGNRDRILTRLEQARQAGAELVLFPELAVTGYPPEDLLLRPGFIRAAEDTLRKIAHETAGLVALVGTPHFDGDLFNACAVCSDGEVKAVYRKQLLPNYGVFDEDRYFTPGRDLVLLRLECPGKARRDIGIEAHSNLARKRRGGWRRGCDLRRAVEAGRAAEPVVKRHGGIGRADHQHHHKTADRGH